MTVGTKDIDRIAAEIHHEDTSEWMERVNVPIETISYIVNKCMEALAIKLFKNRDTEQAVGEIIANAYRMGWECGREYGSRSQRVNS